ncbi:MAG: hypothetical protein WCB27_16260 [Thermoguttaceae bacterium]
MKRLTVLFTCLAFLAAMAAGGYAIYLIQWHARYYEVSRTEYQEPPRQEDVLADDTLAEKSPAFDATLIDSRPLGDWEVNSSAAVVRLDCPMIKPDVEKAMLVLRPSYRDAIRDYEFNVQRVLPSANMLDGAAKQFDDGLYAAVDLACFRGELGLSPAVPQWVASVFSHLPAKSPARAFLAAALELGGEKAPAGDVNEEEKAKWLADFEQDKATSKPIGFYTWTPELQRTSRFYRFLQHEFDADRLAIPRDVAVVLKGHADLLKQYRAINAFYGRLTNPLICLPVDALIDVTQDLTALAKQRGASHATAAVFPPSTSRETELFERLFPDSLPPDVNLMVTLIRRIRSGEVDLKPSQKAGGDGWYQYQVYALETLLLPGRGQEKEKLLLTAEYKKRLVEAFKAMITTRRETHTRQLAKCADKCAPLSRGEVSPRLRIEPCATFYLRTARAYAFLQNFLRSTVGRERLEKLHGLKQGGTREAALDAELDALARRFYGFYLLTCEDIGMKPQFLPDEPVDQAVARREALKWLEHLGTDPDLACDTRVSVPIAVDPVRGKTRFWATVGVRLAHLDASYARPPRVRAKGEKGDWKEVKHYQAGSSAYVIPVVEFAEFELSGSNALSREEFRAVCDRYSTKEEIVQALQK